METATYVMPFIRESRKVTVLGRAVRNGQKKVHILLTSGVDLWVPERRVF